MKLGKAVVPALVNAVMSIHQILNGRHPTFERVTLPGVEAADLLGVHRIIEVDQGVVQITQVPRFLRLSHLGPTRLLRRQLSHHRTDGTVGMMT